MTPPTVIQTAPQVWEYLCFPLMDLGLLGPEKASAMLGLKGKEGWELVSVTAREVQGIRMSECWFKRPMYAALPGG